MQLDDVMDYAQTQASAARIDYRTGRCTVKRLEIFFALCFRYTWPGIQNINHGLSIVSPIVMGFGYVVSMGPVRFYTLWVKQMTGVEPWNIYSCFGIVVIAGLTHVPHVCLYSSAALKSLGSDVKEAARAAGASLMVFLIFEREVAKKRHHYLG